MKKNKRHKQKYEAELKLIKYLNDNEQDINTEQIQNKNNEQRRSNTIQERAKQKP